jgi:hypothetical protein
VNQPDRAPGGFGFGFSFGFGFETVAGIFRPQGESASVANDESPGSRTTPGVQIA